MNATITFPTREQAQQFAVAWSRYCLRGHVISAGPENVSVTVDNISELDKEWINSYVEKLNYPCR